MKRLMMSFAAVALVLLLAACGGASKEPSIALETAAFDFGDVANGRIVTRELAVSNTGDAPLVVERITTSCGCTQATLEPMTIPAGESGLLTIRFDSGAHGPDLTGPMMRQVYLGSNDPDTTMATVEFTANITPPEN